MLLSISWRNVWRNKLRSLVMVIAITLGLCAGIFSTGFYLGMADQRIDKAIKTELSHIQVHQNNFRQAHDITKFIPKGDSLVREFNDMPLVAGASPRIVIFSMIASAENGYGVKIMGIEPKFERKTTNIYTKIVEGNYFEEKKKNPIILGDKLAEKLKVKLGSKVVLTLQDVDNNIISGAFRIVGIFNTVNTTFDESNVFVKYEDLIRLTNLPAGACHEIAISVKNDEDVNLVKDQIAKATGSLEVMTWKELSPEMSYLTEAMDIYMYIFIVIILLALLFGIINTMLMAVLDRIKELGMLMAIGMSRVRVFFMIMLETIFLSLTGGIAGVTLGYLISKYFETHKISLARWGNVYTSIGYDPYVYTSLDWTYIINTTILVFITGVIASIYPAYKALQNDPAQALRIE